MRIFRSIRQCVMSFSHASKSCGVHGFDPPCHAPFCTKHSGDGIYCPTGAWCVSCAKTGSVRSAAARVAEKTERRMCRVVPFLNENSLVQKTRIIDETSAAHPLLRESAWKAARRDA